MDILATALEIELIGKSEAVTRDQMRLAQVKRYMLANLPNTELDLETIAKAQSMGTRTLNRPLQAKAPHLFAGYGGSGLLRAS